MAGETCVSEAWDKVLVTCNTHAHLVRIHKMKCHTDIEVKMSLTISIQIPIHRRHFLENHCRSQWEKIPEPKMFG